MRAISLHPDVLVATSEVWQTTCTAVRSGGEAFVIDSPVYPDELELLPTLMQQAQFIPKGLLVTHGDWDHLLGRLAFPGAALGCAETTAARLTAEPGAAQRELRAFDDEHYVERKSPLSLGQVQALPVPGHARGRRRRAGAAPDRGAHRRRHGDLDPVGAGPRRGRLPLAGRDPDALRDGLARRVRRDAAAPGDAGRAGGARRPGPRRGDGGRPRGGDPARGRRVPRGASGRHVAARAARPCSAGRPQAERRAVHRRPFLPITWSACKISACPSSSARSRSRWTSPRGSPPATPRAPA